MDIHKPKPWHGLREFLKEYVIIVIGVLTALGAEALVEEVRWAERTRQTEAHLIETAHRITVYATERLSNSACTNQMLEGLTTALERDGEAWKPPFVYTNPLLGKGVVVASRRSWLAEDWNAAIADGTANHLRKEKLLAYAKFFQWVGRARTISDREEGDEQELESLASVRKLDSVSRNHYLGLVYRMRADNVGLGIYSSNLLRDAKSLGVPPVGAAEAPSDAAGYRRVCEAFKAGKTSLAFD
jgi:type II secretory pathway pseudopilin PulG